MNKIVFFRLAISCMVLIAAAGKCIFVLTQAGVINEGQLLVVGELKSTWKEAGKEDFLNGTRRQFPDINGTTQNMTLPKRPLFVSSIQTTSRGKQVNCTQAFIASIPGQVRKDLSSMLLPAKTKKKKKKTRRPITHNLPPLPEYALLEMVHRADHPAKLAGKWTYQPQHAMTYSPAHLRCLDQEAQGNCHDPNAWEKETNDTLKQRRHDSILKNEIMNSPGILNGFDPYVWESNHSAYAVLPYTDPTRYKQHLESIFRKRTVYLVGDSLTRQWSQVMKCEVMQLLNMTDEQVEMKIQYVYFHIGVLKYELWPLREKLARASSRDYLVLNLGHHIGETTWGCQWQAQYRARMECLQLFDFGVIPDRHIFFRTTAVRHFIRGFGDYNTHPFQAGGTQPDMNARWDTYGGDYPVQPDQNLMALDILASGKRMRDFQILDIAPMILARADATIDGCHFCLPGPHQMWSQMLYYRIIEQDASTN